MFLWGSPEVFNGSGNTGLPQAFSGGKKTQNKQNSIFGAKNKSSVTVFVECCPETVKARRRSSEQLGTGFYCDEYFKLQ